MHDRQKARDAAMLRELRSLQKAAEQQALADAQAKLDARLREVEDADRGVSEAFDFWLSCVGNQSVLDPAQLGLAAVTLMQCENKLATAGSLHERARDAADSQQRRLAESSTRLTQAEDIVQALNRRLARHLEEQRQSETEERTSFDWSLHV